ncbi:hypothetical protein D3C86_1880530 [compost metagenome]
MCGAVLLPQRDQLVVAAPCAFGTLRLSGCFRLRAVRVQRRKSIAAFFPVACAGDKGHFGRNHARILGMGVRAGHGEKKRKEERLVHCF